MALLRTAAISGFVLVLAACSTILYRPCTMDHWVAVQDSLYFGTVKPDGIVSSEEWAAFLSAVVTPRFPQGLTVWQALGQLPFDQRTAIVLREIHGLSYEEIAASLGVAVGTVKSRLARARSTLRTTLRPHDHD